MDMVRHQRSRSDTGKSVRFRSRKTARKTYAEAEKCFNEIVTIRNSYSRARYGGEASQICPPVKHRQSHLVDPVIDGSREQYCSDRGCRIGDAFHGM